ncbi:MAG: sporulation protein YunB [Clostridiales bacterium]|nr:sporulation protein YunB [Clostridiales bacterium]
MIECTDKYIWYTKKNKKKNKRLFVFFIVFLIIAGFFLYYKSIVSKQIYSICSDYAKSYSITATNDAVLISLSNNLKYSDLIYVEKNTTGDIVLITANSHKINALSREIVYNTKNLLLNQLKKGVPIPFFAFTGIGFLSGYGNNVDYKVLSVSKVDCDFKSEFKSVGINQTLHSIYVEVLSDVKIEVPLMSKSDITTSKILICESVLIGKVPEIYLGGGILNSIIK